MSSFINEIVYHVKESIVNHGIDWIITIIITFVSVRLATKKYYNSVKSRNVKPHMEQGLKLILNGTDIIPANAKSILVKNKGFTIFRWKRYKCEHPFSRLRKTVSTVGGNNNSTSKARALYWGVLGLAYRIESIVVYDFRQHTLLTYGVDIAERCVIEKTDKRNIKKYYYKDEIDGKPCEIYLSDKTTDRNIMIAIPLKNENKLVGGLTFDVDCEINKQDYPDNKKTYLIGETQNEVIEICKTLNDIGSNIVSAYFSER